MAATAQIVWFRRDLRLHDHQPLTDACNVARVDGGVVVPVYVLDPAEFEHEKAGHLGAATGVIGLPRVGPFRAAFLVECLESLRGQLQRVSSRLLIRRGHPKAVLLDLAHELKRQGSSKVELRFHHEIGTEEAATTAELLQSFAKQGDWLHAQVYFGSTLYHPCDLPRDWRDPAQPAPNLAKRARRAKLKQQRQRQYQQHQQRQQKKSSVQLEASKPLQLQLQLEPEPEPEMEPTSDERERSVSIDTYQPGDLVEYNSVTLGGWASAVVGKVYPNGQMQLLGDPGPGATRQQIAAAKGHVLKEYAQSLARLQRCLRKCAHLTRCVLLMLPVARIQRACAGAPRDGNHHKRRRLPPPNAVG